MSAPQFQSQEWAARPRNLSDGGIHSDDTAREMGFAGGFIPGVVLYEHVVGALMNQGVDWLNGGRAQVSFRRPVYDKEEVTFSLDAEARTWSIAGDDDMGPRASGMLDVDDAPPEVPTGDVAPPPGMPIGDPSQIGMLMRSESTLDPAAFDEMAGATGFPRGASDRKLMPVARYVNPVGLVTGAFGLTTTIHYRGRLWHHSPLFEDESFTTTGVLTGFSERRGNKIVEFTSLVTAADGRPIVTIDHASVYELARQRSSE